MADGVHDQAEVPVDPINGRLVTKTGVEDLLHLPHDRA
jgi:hypothetical protein